MRHGNTTLRLTECCGGRLAPFFRQHGTQIKVAPGAVIAHQGEAATKIYRVVRGCVRSTVYSQDGDRKVLQFLGAGDILGLGNAADWPASQEAVDMVVLESAPRHLLEAELAADPDLERTIRDCLAQQIASLASLLVLTAQTTAVERVKAFLQGFVARRASTSFVSLPMSRQDIADHIGLSMETVSRAFSALKAQGQIELRGANFVRLIQSADDERGFADAA